MSDVPDSVTVVNKTVEDHELMSADDAAWALTCAFLILTMQTGFAMLECGTVSPKNVANIMMKNVVDVTIGGFSYWIFGYGLSFGKKSNMFTGYIDESNPDAGALYAKYFFQFSFATTATTIVSGAVAERMTLYSYMMFSFFNTFIYCLPACWAWNTGTDDFDWNKGFYNNTGGLLFRLGFFDFAGVCVVHLCGGTSALVAAYMLGPRTGRFEKPEQYRMSSPVTSLTGMFMLWWAWLGFNCGSTFGVSGFLWKLTALVSVTTLNGAIGGGLFGMIISAVVSKGKIVIDHSINSILGGLVGITGIAAVTSPAEALLIGGVGGTIAVLGGFLMEYIKIDDPVGAAPVHLFAAAWGTIAVGIFGKDNAIETLRGLNGLAHGGSFYLVGIQTLGVTLIFFWSAVTTYIAMFLSDKLIGMRMSEEHEILGADWVEHGIQSTEVGRIVEMAIKKEQGKPPDRRKSMFVRLRSTLDNSNQVDVQHHKVFAVDKDPDDPSDADRIDSVIEAYHVGSRDTTRNHAPGTVTELGLQDVEETTAHVVY